MENKLLIDIINNTKEDVIVDNDRNTEFYSNLYEKLYSTGYHNDPTLSHTIPVLNYLISHNIHFKSMLDVGCSIGNACLYMMQHGVKCAGIDISEIAVQRAKTRGVKKCKAASACNIPFNDKSFELVISTDVIEHLKEEDVELSIREMFRISKRYIVIKPCTHEEKNKVPLLRAKQQYPDLKDIDNLHLTVKPISWYHDIVEKVAKETNNNIMRYNQSDTDTNTMIYRLEQIS
jgi:ubiquinone/menaquinone biosynthesis C-methylase UbiE